MYIGEKGYTDVSVGVMIQLVRNSRMCEGVQPVTVIKSRLVKESVENSFLVDYHSCIATCSVF